MRSAGESIDGDLHRECVKVPYEGLSQSFRKNQKMITKGFGAIEAFNAALGRHESKEELLARLDEMDSMFLDVQIQLERGHADERMAIATLEHRLKFLNDLISGNEWSSRSEDPKRPNRNGPDDSPNGTDAPPARKRRATAARGGGLEASMKPPPPPPGMLPAPSAPEADTRECPAKGQATRRPGESAQRATAHRELDRASSSVSEVSDFTSMDMDAVAAELAVSEQATNGTSQPSTTSPSSSPSAELVLQVPSTGPCTATAATVAGAAADDAATRRQRVLRGTIELSLNQALVRKGYLKAAVAHARESGLGEHVVDAALACRHMSVENSIREGRRLSDVLEWCLDHGSRLRRIDSSLEFAVRVRQFLELVRSKQQQDALAHACEFMAPCLSSRCTEKKNQVQEAMAVLAINEDIPPVHVPSVE